MTMRALVILTAVFLTSAYALDAPPQGREQAAGAGQAERTDGLQTRRNGQGHQAVGW
jgi:hypothetical protein